MSKDCWTHSHQPYLALPGMISQCLAWLCSPHHCYHRRPVGGPWPSIAGIWGLDSTSGVVNIQVLLHDHCGYWPLWTLTKHWILLLQWSTTVNICWYMGWSLRKIRQLMIVVKNGEKSRVLCCVQKFVGPNWTILPKPWEASRATTGGQEPSG